MHHHFDKGRFYQLGGSQEIPPPKHIMNRHEEQDTVHELIVKSPQNNGDIQDTDCLPKQDGEDGDQNPVR